MTVKRLTEVPRLRVFAGPNGSGKSTIKDQIDPVLIKAYVNADELEKEAKTTGFIDLASFSIETTLAQLLDFHANHRLIESKGLAFQAKKIKLIGSRIDYRSVCIDSYFASVLADFLRQCLLDQHMSFTFETVMSHTSKVDFMKDAQARAIEFICISCLPKTQKSILIEWLSAFGKEVILWPPPKCMKGITNLFDCSLKLSPQVTALIYSTTRETELSFLRKSPAVFVSNSARMKFQIGSLKVTPMQRQPD